MGLLFKICEAAAWAEATESGGYGGSAVDRRDGFIHLSAETQVRETAARHFAGKDSLVLIAFAEEGLANLRWEASRGGALFPHVYGSLPVSAALWVRNLPLVAGAHRFPDGIPA